MDRRFLDMYNQEIAFLRAMGAEFAQEFPKIAGRLGGLDEFQPCRDPFVERLLEGFAFLSTRVQIKLDSEFPRFTQSLLDTVYPHYLTPTPSMAIAQFEPDFSDGGLAEGHIIPRGSSLLSVLAETDETRCEYRTAHDVTLWPIQIVQADYFTRELASLQVPNLPNVKAGIRIRLQSVGGLQFSKLKLDSLVFHLMGTGDMLMRLYEQIIGDAVVAVVVQPASRPLKWQKILEKSSIRSVGFQDDQKMLPYDARSFSGYRLLHEYFAFPQRYMFAEFTQLASSIQSCESNQLDLIVLLQKPDLDLEGIVDADNFALFCSPAINLFDKRTDRIHVTDKSSEFHVVPDRTRPQDFEVFNVNKVVGYGGQSKEVQEFLPFYAAKDLGHGEGEEAYYVTNRVPRRLSQREKLHGRRSSTYTGSEVYISIVEAGSTPYSSDIDQLGVGTLCTNRDMPLHMPIGRGRTDFTMEKAAPYTSIRCLGNVSSPEPAPEKGQIAWKAVNHLAVNYLSLADTTDQEGASALRDILRLYAENRRPETRKQIDGLRSISCKPITRRIATSGTIAFARGMEVAVTFDDALFEGSGVFLLGAVLEQFFARYASINSFTETVIKTLGRGVIIRWPMRLGLRQIL